MEVTRLLYLKKNKIIYNVEEKAKKLKKIIKTCCYFAINFILWYIVGKKEALTLINIETNESSASAKIVVVELVVQATMP